MKLFSHGGTEARKIRIQIPLDDPSDSVAHQRLTKAVLNGNTHLTPDTQAPAAPMPGQGSLRLQQTRSYIPVQLHRTADHEGDYPILLHLRVLVPP